MAPVEVADLIRRQAQSYLDDLLATLPEGVRLGSIATIGIPWQAICDAAKQHHADLIVIGSHGYSGIDRLVGTTAAKVVNTARGVLGPRRPQPADLERSGRKALARRPPW